ncbi:MAG: phosphate ABC transporter permease subunit PstC [Planctomycetia bacterium]|nr:phosphate ABC transporter permease subunit PstC [Planctomycetia bacterium]
MRRPPSFFQTFYEWWIELSLKACGLLSIGITVAIACVLVFGAEEFFRDPHVSIIEFLTGTEWTAPMQPAKYGIWPLLVGTLMVAGIAGIIALPLGLTTAIYLSEYAHPKVRDIAKPILELLAGIPTVVYGFFAVYTITPMLDHLFPWLHIGRPYNQISGGIVVAIMILPIIASLSEDALRSVPRALRDASYALGATQFETSTQVVVPAALSGVMASFILGLSRAIGETMAVTLACGGLTQLSFDPRVGVATMTAYIVRIAKGDLPWGSTEFNSLFAVGLTLFFMTLAMNFVAEWIRARYRLVYQ